MEDAVMRVPVVYKIPAHFSYYSEITARFYQMAKEAEATLTSL